LLLRSCCDQENSSIHDSDPEGLSKADGVTSDDVLVIYTDGVSEAGESEDGDSEEFGEERLIASIRKQQQQSAGDVLDGILSEVQQFSRAEQADDMTLIVARGR
jgi:serine phosphatase RsbU (regulator of sigma subunit)